MIAPRGQLTEPHERVWEPTTSPRAQLKAATAAAHQQLDALFSRFDLTEPNAYRGFLAVHATVVPRCEATLAASDATSLVPDWPDRIRTPALARDLAAIGGQASKPPSIATPIEPAAAFGMMYVLEGSRLGGAVLARRVQNNPDPRCREATSYLRHGAGLTLWPSFIARLETADCVRTSIEVAIASAITTFGLFSDAAEFAEPPPIG